MTMLRDDEMTEIEPKDGDVAFETDWILYDDVNVNGGKTFVQIQKVHIVRRAERRRFGYMVRRKTEDPDLSKYVTPLEIKVEVGRWKDARALYEDHWCQIVCTLLEGCGKH